YVRAERVGPFSFRSTDIGVVHDLMIHDLDLVADLVRSDVRRVEAFGVGLMGEHEDSVQARLVFENGCIADLTASRLSPVARRQMQVWSSSGTVTVDFTSREVTAYQPSDALLYGPSPVQRSRQPGADVEQLKRDVFGHFLRIEQPAVPATDALTAELIHFVECVRQGSQPLVGGEEALRAMTLADAVLSSVAAHEWDGSAEGAIGPFARSAATRKRAG
ncbi:MAG: Gfo/Idh/MocA family protein, partial [Planctomycetaceae bacterium]